jgi:hypothetical protein
MIMHVRVDFITLLRPLVDQAGALKILELIRYILFLRLPYPG